MLLTNYDFYDIYWSIVLLRSNRSKYDVDIAKAIKQILDAPQKDNTVESNIIRRALCSIDALNTEEKWQWIEAENVYTYGVSVIKDDLSYQILSASMDEMLLCLENPKDEQLYDLADALHNLPVILANKDRKWKRSVACEIATYRKKWNSSFLKQVMKR